MAKSHHHTSRPRSHRPFLRLTLMLAALVAVCIAAYANRPVQPRHQPSKAVQVSPTPVTTHAGSILGIDSTQQFTAAQTTELVRQNYGAVTPAIAAGLVKVTFHYLSQLPDGKPITVYGRAYVPDDLKTDLPIFAFAPGTTGIGDQCAASLEQPAKANWANYDSHMAAYASQGYAAVTTDYEGMRDPGRIHHYMIGELEGRALLDSVRALKALPLTKSRLNTAAVFVAGYSQGGHAAFWADKIAATYAPDVKPVGVIGFGPVMSVKQTLTDITRGANINWFGPSVLYSYQDYYNTTYDGVVLSGRLPTLAAEVTGHCIDTDLPYWGHVPASIYTPEFINAAANNLLAEEYPAFNKALDDNAVGAPTTSSFKRINQGVNDNVVLQVQQTAVAPGMCAAGDGAFQYVPYANTTHYNTMLHSFNDTLGWMKAVTDHQQIYTTCQ